MGRSVTSYAEDYPKKMARAIVTGLMLPQVPSFGQTEHSEVFYESEGPAFDGQFGHPNVARCGLFAGTVLDAAFPASSDEPTVFKVTDPEISKQLNALQFNR